MSDRFANTASKKLAITLEKSDSTESAEDGSGNNGVGFHMLAIPEPSISGDQIDLFVGKNLDNAILYYVTYDNPRGECYIDVDIMVDTDED
ncbi:MAG: hypothetical protein ACTSU7_10490 [Candidatus Heimdallarchaeaceae archaeon]